MFGFDFLTLFAPARQLTRFEGAPGVELVSANHEPSLVEVPPEERQQPSAPKPKARRAHGPRMANGLNTAVMRAIVAGWSYLNSDCTLAQAASAYGVSIAYVRAVIHLRLARQDALLDAAFNGDVPLLVAAYETATATNITVTTNN